MKASDRVYLYERLLCSLSFLFVFLWSLALVFAVVKENFSCFFLVVIGCCTGLAVFCFFTFAVAAVDVDAVDVEFLLFRSLLSR